MKTGTKKRNKSSSKNGLLSSPSISLHQEFVASSCWSRANCAFKTRFMRIVLLSVAGVATVAAVDNILKFCSIYRAGIFAMERQRRANEADENERCSVQIASVNGTNSFIMKSPGMVHSMFYATMENVSKSFNDKDRQVLGGFDLHDYHICRSAHKMPGYRCEGHEYEEFADRMENMIRFKHFCWLNNNITSKWGKRDSPFPANSTILAIGNSQTRQFLQSMACQYATLRYIIDVDKQSTDIMQRGFHLFVEFQNGAKLHMVINDASFYSKHWLRYLEAKAANGQPLEETFDILIVGDFNQYSSSNQNTTFNKQMLEQSKLLEDVDFLSIQPPTLFDVAQHFSGPIVSFSKDKCKLVKEAYTQIQHQQPRRNNIRLIKGMRYESEIGHCVSDQWKDVGVCRNITKGHRCIGERGGHPDLISWDVIEAVHDLSQLSAKWNKSLNLNITVRDNRRLN